MMHEKPSARSLRNCAQPAFCEEYDDGPSGEQRAALRNPTGPEGAGQFERYISQLRNPETLLILASQARCLGSPESPLGLAAEKVFGIAAGALGYTKAQEIVDRSKRSCAYGANIQPAWRLS